MPRLYKALRDAAVPASRHDPGMTPSSEGAPTGVLRSASPADIDLLLPLERDFCAHFGYPFDEPRKRGALSQALGDPSLGRIWLVLSDRGDVAGYLFLSFYFSLEFGGRTAFVDELFVLPESRGAGLGERALRSALGAARELGVTAVQLEVEKANPRAAALYLRLGFVDYDRTLLTYRL
jgi:ribosomal protein S18 acetylase RimI-like enzyme